MLIDKKALKSLLEIQKKLDGAVDDIDETKVRDLDESLIKLDEIIKDMQKKVTEDIKNTKMPEETKDYVIKYMDDPNSDIIDLIDLDFGEEEESKSKEAGGEKAVGPDVDLV